MWSFIVNTNLSCYLVTVLNRCCLYSSIMNTDDADGRGGESKKLWFGSVELKLVTLYLNDFTINGISVRDREVWNAWRQAHACGWMRVGKKHLCDACAGGDVATRWINTLACSFHEWETLSHLTLAGTDERIASCCERGRSTPWGNNTSMWNIKHWINPAGPCVCALGC